MTEHEHKGAPFDDQAVAESLGARSATVRDVAYGEGVQYSICRGDARLEVYPRTGVTRLTAQDVRVELFGSAVTNVSSGGVEFFRSQPGQDASLTVVPGGGIVFTLVAAGGRRTPLRTEPHTTPPSPAKPALTSPETAQEREDLDTGLPHPSSDRGRACRLSNGPRARSPIAGRGANDEPPADSGGDRAGTDLIDRPAGTGPALSHHHDRLARGQVPARRAPRGRAHRLAHRARLWLVLASDWRNPQRELFGESFHTHHVLSAAREKREGSMRASMPACYHQLPLGFSRSSHSPAYGALAG